MKIKVTTVEEVEIDVTFPHYRANRAYVYKIISENGPIISVSMGGISPQIEQTINNIDFIMQSTKECTDEQFDVQFACIANKLMELAQ